MTDNPRNLRRRPRAQTLCTSCGGPTRATCGLCIYCMPPPSVTYNKDIGVITIGGKFSLSIASAGKVSDALVDLLDEIDADGQANG